VEGKGKVKEGKGRGSGGKLIKLLNIVLSYTMPWRNINDLTK